LSTVTVNDHLIYFLYSSKLIFCVK
jgi:hypothetical protein